MVKLRCQDYGLKCNFEATGKNLFRVVEFFGRHTRQIHGEDYSKEALTQYIIRMQM